MALTLQEGMRALSGCSCERPVWEWCPFCARRGFSAGMMCRLCGKCTDRTVHDFYGESDEVKGGR